MKKIMLILVAVIGLAAATPAYAGCHRYYYRSCGYYPYYRQAYFYGNPYYSYYQPYYYRPYYYGGGVTFSFGGNQWHHWHHHW